MKNEEVKEKVCLIEVLQKAINQEKNHIKNCDSNENLCQTGMQQSPIIIDANTMERKNDSKRIFTFISFNHHKIILSITSFDHGPWLEYNEKTFALYKIRFMFKYGIKGGLHRLINFGTMEKPVGEILMEFEQCHKNPKEKGYFFVSTILILANQTKLKMDIDMSGKEIINLNYIIVIQKDSTFAGFKTFHTKIIYWCNVICWLIL
uniref:Uncharacterized protein n=1 Tax=Wuchereria bancrofti TaxID=6293 RepID=A0A1I8EV07_WUCBA